MAKRFEEIDLYGNREIQLSLFETIENKKRLKPESFFPKYARGEKYIREILENPEQYTGIDLEFDPSTNKPTIIGLSNSKLAASMPFSKEVARTIVEYAKLGITKLVGFSIMGAEKTVLEKELGEELPLSIFEDGIVTHFLLNQDLVKMSQGKEESEKGSIGFLNLWTMNTFYVGLPQFKLCRELGCKGPCPKHDVWGYNAMDTHVGREGFIRMLKDMAYLNIPYQFYRDLLEVNLIAQKMQEKGIKVNRELVDKLDRIIDEDKEKLFPYTGTDKKKKYEHFNPNSPTAAIKYFAKHNINLEKWNPESIHEALEELAENEGLNVSDILGKPLDFPLHYQLLVKGYQYKGAGKGFKSWFDDKFFGRDGLMHPRFVCIGTSTGRFSSRSPNFQNIPSYDEDTPREEQSSFGQARIAIVPRSDDLCIIKADKSNLEFRMCMWYAGFDTYKIEKDAFQWMVDTSDGAYKDAAKFLGKSERFVAKSVAHGSNYLEGIIILDRKTLDKKSTRKAIEMGSIILYEDWEYGGGLVAFSGINLAQRLFHDTSLEARARANQILEGIYFKKFDIIRKWHKEVLTVVDLTGIITSATKRFLRLNDTPLNSAKQAVSFLGQGTSADHVQGDMLVFYRKYGNEGIPLLQVHDELVFEKPKIWTDEECVNFLSIMEREDERIKGFYCPCKMYRGENWAEIKRIK